MIVLGGDVEGDFCCVLTNQRAEPILSCRLPTFETGLVIQSLRCRDTTFEAKSQGWSVPSSGSRHWCPGLKMDHPILLLFGMIAISTLLFALVRYRLTVAGAACRVVADSRDLRNGYILIVVYT